MGGKVADTRRDDRHAACREGAGPEQLVGVSGGEAGFAEERDAALVRLMDVDLRARGDVANSSRRPIHRAIRGEHGISRRAGEEMRDRGTAKWDDRSVTLAMHFGVDDG